MKKLVLLLLVTVLALQANATTVGLWGLNQSSGTTAVDSSGYGNTATLHGFSAPVWQASDNTANLGDWGNEVRFQPQGAYIDLGSGGEMDIASSFTAECWVQTGYVDDYDRIMTRNDGTNVAFAMWFRNSTTVQFAIYFAGGTKTASWSGAALNDGNYHHVAARFNDADNSLRIYVDGVQGSTVAYAGASDSVPIVGSWNVGAYVRSSTYITNGTSADFDEIRISDTALMPSELGYFAGPLAAVPEPATILILGCGLGFVMRRK